MKLNFDNISIKKYIGIIVLLTFIIYGNSINNEYALDDNIVVDGNKVAEKGLKAIPEIFSSRYSTDSKQSYDYRPMVITSFAIEKQFFKKLPASQSKSEKKRKDKLTQANVSHFVNVLLYAFVSVLIFNLLIQVLPNYSILFPFLTTILFVVHPIHTEVVCSLKNRDEILMLIGLVSALSAFIKYSRSSKIKYLLFGIGLAAFALLSKRNAMALIALVPVFLYFVRAKWQWIVILYLSMVAIYVAFNWTQKAILPDNQVRIFKYFENPLMYEDWSWKRVSASLYFSWFYFEMLLFPKKLSFYYGYNQVLIPDWTYWKVWISLLFHGTLGVYGVYALIKRRIEGLAIVFWFGLLMGVNNIKFLLPGILADRFAFALSLGFCILLVWLIFKIFKIDLKQKTVKLEIPNGLIVVFAIITLVYSGRTIARNPDWHDYLTLYKNDIKHIPESAKAHAILANTLYPQVIIKYKQNPANPEIRKDVQKLIFHFKESIRIDSTYSTSLNNLGSVYLNFNRDFQNAIKYCSKAIEYDPDYVEAHFNSAFSYNALGKFDEAIKHIKKIIEVDPDYLKNYDLLNKMLAENRKVDEGIQFLNELAKTSKSPKSILVNIANLYSSKGESSYHKALDYFIKAHKEDSTDQQLCQHIISLATRLNRNDIAKEYQSICQ